MLSAWILMPGLAFSNPATSPSGVAFGSSKWYHHRTVTGRCACGAASGMAAKAAPASAGRRVMVIGPLLVLGWAHDVVSPEPAPPLACAEFICAAADARRMIPRHERLAVVDAGLVRAHAGPRRPDAERRAGVAGGEFGCAP